MAGHCGLDQPAVSVTAAAISLTARQAEVLELVTGGVPTKQIARHLGISVRTVQDHLARIRQVTGARREGELIARVVMAGLITPVPVPPASLGGARMTGPAARPRQPSQEMALPGTPATLTAPLGVARRRGPSCTGGAPRGFRDGIRDNRLVSIPVVCAGGVRIGYARISTCAEDHQAQLGALAAARCDAIAVETASTRAPWPKLRCTLAAMHPGDTLVIYKPDRIARSMRDLRALLEDQLYARGINLHVLAGICAGVHRPDGATIAGKMLLTAAAIAAEMERELTRERTLDGLRTAQAWGRSGGRPAAVSDDILAIVRARRDRGESVTAIARNLGVGRSTLYRALDLEHDNAAPPEIRTRPE
jgi:DNA invertase Pin-like site-specific DNA recombinase